MNSTMDEQSDVSVCRVHMDDGSDGEEENPHASTNANNPATADFSATSQQQQTSRMVSNNIAPSSQRDAPLSPPLEVSDAVPLCPTPSQQPSSVHNPFNGATATPAANANGDLDHEGHTEPTRRNHAFAHLHELLSNSLGLFHLLFRWFFLVVPMGAVIGSACAWFLYTVDLATKTRYQQPWLLYLLPVAGLFQAGIYYRWGSYRGASEGVNLIIEQIHTPDMNKGRATIPTRMGVLVWVGTFLSHLCGASIGREGTALQVAGSISNFYLRMLRKISCGRGKLDKHTTRIMTIASVAAGFGGVFGTPLAGAVFSLEVLAIGSISTEAILPCILCSIASTYVTDKWLELFNMSHSHYTVTAVDTDLNLQNIFTVAVCGLAFGATSLIFSTSIHFIKDCYKSVFNLPFIKTRVPIVQKYPSFFISLIGAGLVIAMVYIFQTRDYLGIGTIRPSDDDSTVIISTCFQDEGDCYYYSFVLKTLFTVVSLASGYKGGEVTCLFYIGSSLGWALSHMFNRAHAVDGDASFFASLGFVSVFAGASNTPLASTIMAWELFGGKAAVLYAESCYIAYIVTGLSGIYATQRVASTKMGYSVFHRISFSSHPLPVSVSATEDKKEVSTSANTSLPSPSSPPRTKLSMYNVGEEQLLFRAQRRQRRQQAALASAATSSVAAPAAADVKRDGSSAIELTNSVLPRTDQPALQQGASPKV